MDQLAQELAPRGRAAVPDRRVRPELRRLNRLLANLCFLRRCDSVKSELLKGIKEALQK